jgi:hypothetical protein
MASDFCDNLVSRSLNVSAILDKRDSIVAEAIALSVVFTVAFATGIFKALRARKKPKHPVFLLIVKTVTPYYL